MYHSVVLSLTLSVAILMWVRWSTWPLRSSKKVKGTVRYATSCQCVLDLIVFKVADWWSMGILLYELVVGRSPFCGDNASTDQITHNILHAVLLTSPSHCTTSLTLAPSCALSQCEPNITQEPEYPDHFSEELTNLLQQVSLICDSALQSDVCRALIMYVH